MISLIRRSKSPRIVIVGGSFAGLSAAATFSKSYDVTLIDTNSVFEFKPNLHEIISGRKTAKEVCLSRQKQVEKLGHSFVCEEVIRIDPDEKRVFTKPDKSYDYDLLLVCIGSESNLKQFSNTSKTSFTVKNRHECNSIREHLLKIHEKDNQNIVVVGGGYEGVEVLGELLRGDLFSRNYTVHVVETTGKLMPTTNERLSDELRILVQNHPVKFYFETGVQKITNKTVYLTNAKKIPTDLTIWCAGNSAISLPMSGQELFPPSVHDTLQSTEYESIFIAGDAAEVTNATIRKQAYHAIEMGTCAGKNMQRYLKGKKLKKFKSGLKPMLLSFGELATFMIFGKAIFSWKPFAGAKEAVFQLVMPQFDPGGIVAKNFNRAVRTQRYLFRKDSYREVVKMISGLPDFKILI